MTTKNRKHYPSTDIVIPLQSIDLTDTTQFDALLKLVSSKFFNWLKRSESIMESNSNLIKNEIKKQVQETLNKIKQKIIIESEQETPNIDFILTRSSYVPSNERGATFHFFYSNSGDIISTVDVDSYAERVKDSEVKIQNNIIACESLLKDIL